MLHALYDQPDKPHDAPTYYTGGNTENQTVWEKHQKAPNGSSVFVLKGLFHRIAAVQMDGDGKDSAHNSACDSTEQLTLSAVALRTQTKHGAAEQGDDEGEQRTFLPSATV